VFTSVNYQEHIMATAIGDLQDFLYRDVMNSMVPFEAVQEANSIDPNFELNDDETIASFTTRLLDWLEERKVVLKAPWLAENGDTKLEGCCRKYLDFLERWCVSISGSVIGKPGIQPEIQIQRLLRFATYVANNRLSSGAWRFTFTAADPKLLLGYASLLVVDVANHNLFVCYDDKRFARTGKDIVVRSALKQKAILHSLGLARTNLDWFLSVPEITTRVIAPPRCEADACMYEYAIKALISSGRARIRYLLGMGDNEWTEI